MPRKSDDLVSDCIYQYALKDVERDPVLYLMFRMGKESFIRFQKKFGGARIRIPKFGKVLPCSRCSYLKQCICMLHETGRSVQWLAKKFGISTTHVYAQLKKSI